MLLATHPTFVILFKISYTNNANVIVAGMYEVEAPPNEGLGNVVVTDLRYQTVNFIL
jgi:hypothetical protein